MTYFSKDGVSSLEMIKIPKCTYMNTKERNRTKPGPREVKWAQYEQVNSADEWSVNHWVSSSNNHLFTFLVFCSNCNFLLLSFSLIACLLTFLFTCRTILWFLFICSSACRLHSPLHPSNRAKRGLSKRVVVKIEHGCRRCCENIVIVRISKRHRLMISCIYEVNI